MKNAWLLLPLTALLAAMSGFFLHGYPSTHSYQYNISWVYQFPEQFFSGQWYPQWLEYSFAGRGNPTFAFHPPVSAYALVPFAALGLPYSDAVAASMFPAALLLCIGAYVLARHIFRNNGQNSIAPIVAALTVCAPYFLDDMYVRGTLGEIWGIVWLPWLWWSLLLNLKSGRHWWAAAFFYALLILSHLPTLLNMSVLLALLPWVLARGGTELLLNLKRLYTPLIIGACLSGFYLLPAHFDQGFISLGHQGSSMFIADSNPLNRFIINGLVDFAPRWTNGYAYERGLIPIWFFVGALFLSALVVFLRRRPLLVEQRQPFLMVLFILAFSVFMQTDLSAWLYRVAPLLQKIQFPWRWMAPAAVAAPIAAGFIIAASASYFAGRSSILARGAVSTFAGLLLLFPFFTSMPYTWLLGAEGDNRGSRFVRPVFAQMEQLLAARPPYPREVDVEAKVLSSNYSQVITEKEEIFFLGMREYTPIWADKIYQSGFTPRNQDLLEWRRGGGEAKVLEWRPGYRRIKINAAPNSALALRMHYWPGWLVSIGDAVVESRPADDACLLIHTPPGEHVLEIKYTGTVNALYGGLLSVLTLLLGAAFLLFRFFKKTRAKRAF